MRSYLTLPSFLGTIVFINPTRPITAYSSYPNKLPNAITDNWVAIGHIDNIKGKDAANAVGTGKQNLNAFGVKVKEFFAKAGNTVLWNEDLCKDDSDGDGATNGEELGDPACQWTETAKPTTTCSDVTKLTHPGIKDGADCKTSTDLSEIEKELCNVSGPFKCEAPAAENKSGSSGGGGTKQGVPLISTRGWGKKTPFLGPFSLKNGEKNVKFF